VPLGLVADSAAGTRARRCDFARGSIGSEVLFTRVDAKGARLVTTSNAEVEGRGATGAAASSVQPPIARAIVAYANAERAARARGHEQRRTCIEAEI
jgi:hypothetical protein